MLYAIRTGIVLLPFDSQFEFLSYKPYDRYHTAEDINNPFWFSPISSPAEIKSLEIWQMWTMNSILFRDYLLHNKKSIAAFCRRWETLILPIISILPPCLQIHLCLAYILMFKHTHHKIRNLNKQELWNDSFIPFRQIYVNIIHLTTLNCVKLIGNLIVLNF